MSFMVPFWPCTDSGPAPLQGGCVRSHACPEEDVYSLNDSCSYFSQHLFPPSVSHQRTVNISLYTKQWHTFLLYGTSHSYVHSQPHIIHHTYVHSHLYFICSSWQAGCPRLFVSDTIGLLLYWISKHMFSKVWGYHGGSDVSEERIYIEAYSPPPTGGGI
jgi:hypothetical protein